MDDENYVNLLNKACRTEILKHEKSAEEPEWIFEFDVKKIKLKYKKIHKAIATNLYSVNQCE